MDTAETENSGLLTSRQTAKMLGVCENTLAVWRRSKQHLPFIQAGCGYLRYRRADVERFLETRTVKPEQTERTPPNGP